MIKVAVMLLSIMTILCMLYPIRPGYRNEREFLCRQYKTCSRPTEWV